MLRGSRLAAGVVAAVIACTPAATPAGEQDDEESKVIAGSVVRHTLLGGEGVQGLSGMSRNGASGYLAVAERERRLVRISERGGRFMVTAQLPITGVPDGLDTEALASLGGDEVAIGTEGHKGRARDQILIARLSEGGAEVTERIPFEYGPWGLRAGVNHGIEALCFAEGVLVVATEVVGTVDGKRFAPLARYDRASRQWAFGRLWLSSTAGKISSLECRKSAVADQLEVIAIERHFGVCRLLEMELPRRGAFADVTPRVRMDLAGSFDPLPNLESLAWTDDGGLVLVSDNSNVLVKKPSDVFVIAPPARAAKQP